MFTSPDLAARIDRAEGRLCASIAREFQHARVIEIGGGVAVFPERDSPSNKLIGAGFSGPVDDTILSGVDAHFTAEHARLQAEISSANALVARRSGFSRELRAARVSSPDVAGTSTQPSRLKPTLKRSAYEEAAYKRVAAYVSLPAGAVARSR